MEKMFLSYILSSFLLLFSCNKKQDPPQVLPPSNSLKVLWEHALDDTTEYVASMDPFLQGDILIASYQSIDTAINETVFALNKNDGTEFWEWNDYIRPAPQRVRGSNRIHIKNNILLACSSQDNYGIDINSGSTLWATNNEEGGSRTSLFNDLLFHTETFGNPPNGDSTNIIMRNVSSGAWQKVIGTTKIDDFEVRFGTPAIYINDVNDTLLLFQNRQMSLVSFIEKVDLYCYNMTADSILWFKDNITSSGSSNNRTPIVEGDRFYFGGKWDFLCIDIPSGEIIWNHNFYWDFQGSNYVIYNNLIITNLDNGDLIAINKNTGDQVWVNVGLSYCCVELRIYEDRIYFGNHNLYIVDANSGDLLHKFKSPHYKYGGEFYNAIAVDLEANRMYTTDGKFLMCFELPE